jgi:hypothetical protein
MRTRADAPSADELRMKVVSYRLNCRASERICPSVSPSPSSMTASGFPEKGSPGTVKTLRVRKR